ncbi:hypothetical protein [Kangiella sediminilitoris]|uniref:DUF4440 domain-containing protein n=1 Tax=Kangiella sediminilitoris TaxID=1144748 RepID=A0A1B3B7S3_9GAMM|nr:hypothetical protein [Kangiella sediminilitoris]AOE48845.1 hypothetical protein KS2013_115 [Kangiella sediminilitoris]
MRTIVKKLLFIFLWFSVSSTSSATESSASSEQSPEQVAAILWQSLSREPNSKPDVTTLRQILHPEAKIFGSFYNGDEPQLHIITTAAFIQSLNKTFDTGFYECEIKRQVQKHDRFAQVYSVVESRSQKDSKKPDFIGINSIQLYKNGEQWQIVSLYYHIDQDSTETLYNEEISGHCL